MTYETKSIDEMNADMDRQFPRITDDALTGAQKKAVQYLRRFAEDQISTNAREKYGAQVINFVVRRIGHRLVTVAFEIDFTGLSENNMLRFVSHQYWHIFIGPRGKKTAKGFPDSFKQFVGKYAFDIKFENH